MSELINLLIVDDEPIILETLDELFSEHNHSVRAVDSLAAAEITLDTCEVDAIISDYNLKDSTTGVDLLAKIRKKGFPTPFILISGDVTNDLIFAGLRLGAFEILDKPLNFDVLIQSVLHAINCGIQYRTMQERIRNKLHPDDARILLQSLRMTSMLRYANFDRLRLSQDSEREVG